MTDLEEKYNNKPGISAGAYFKNNTFTNYLPPKHRACLNFATTMMVRNNYVYINSDPRVWGTETSQAFENLQLEPVAGNLDYLKDSRGVIVSADLHIIQYDINRFQENIQDLERFLASDPWGNDLDASDIIQLENQMRYHVNYRQTPMYLETIVWRELANEINVELVKQLIANKASFSYKYEDDNYSLVSTLGVEALNLKLNQFDGEICCSANGTNTKFVFQLGNPIKTFWVWRPHIASDQNC